MNPTEKAILACLQMLLLWIGVPPEDIPDVELGGTGKSPTPPGKQ